MRARKDTPLSMSSGDGFGKKYGKMLEKDGKSNKRLIKKLIIKAPKVKPKI